MTFNTSLIKISLAVAGVALAIAFDPLIAAYVFAALGIVIVAGFIAAACGKSVQDWALGHGWTLPRVGWRTRHVR